MNRDAVSAGWQKQTSYVRFFSFAWMKKSVIIDIICFLFILLFVYAAVSKLMDYDKFRLELGKSPLLTSIASWVTIGIPIVEIVIAILLSIEHYRLLGLYMSFSLMVMFTAYLIAILQYSYYIPCTCGGILEKFTWSTHIWFNCFFIVLAIIAVLAKPDRNKI